MESLQATLFSDPMMGLAYECEPTLDRLAQHYGERFQQNHAMVVLVRDVADYMNPEELALPEDEGIARYNKRLAQIYLSEEPIGHLPMNMDAFHLFDKTHRTSEPLCRAFAAVRVVTPQRVVPFLRALRRATIVEGRQTTRDDVLRDVARETGIDLVAFDQAFYDGPARKVLRADEELAARVGVQGLPALLLRAGDRAVLASPLVGYERLVCLIDAFEQRV